VQWLEHYWTLLARYSAGVPHAGLYEAPE